MYDKALETIEMDGLPFCRVPMRLARDFHVRPAQTTVRRWFRAPLREAPPTLDTTSFSGVLCVDEVYQRDKAVLLAVDPHGTGPLLATRVIVGDLQPAHVEAFFQQLQGAGITPRQLVTDESRLYLPVVKKVWPEVTHQLCLFHVGKNINERLTELLRTWRHTLPTPTTVKCKKQSLRGRVKDIDSPLAQRKAAAIDAVFRLREAELSQGDIVRITGHGINTVKKWLAGPRTPAVEPGAVEPVVVLSPPPEGWASWEQVGQVRNSLLGHKGWLLGHAARWTDEQRMRFAVLLDSPLAEPLRTVRALIEGGQGLWRREDGSRPTVAESRVRFEAWSNEARFQTDAVLSGLVKRLMGKFEQLVPFLNDPSWQGTNNAAERAARAFRRWQRPHYRLRTRASLERQLAGRMLQSDRTVPSVGRCTKGRRLDRA